MNERYLLSKNVNLQCRKVQSPNKDLNNAILKICKSCDVIQACFLLDAKKPPFEEIHTLIAVSVDGLNPSMDEIAQRFQNALKLFPSQAKKFWIISSRAIEKEFLGKEFYIRN